MMRFFWAGVLLFFLSFSSVEGRDFLKEQAKIYREEGYKLQSEGDLKNALVYYQKAYEIDPSFIEVINDLGVVYEALGDDEAALAMYKRALEIDNNYLPTYTNLAFFYEKKRDIENATTYWEKRYELGEEGEYWWEVSREHLLKLGTYPKIRKKILERKAVEFSRELAYKREQQRLEKIEEAKLHFNIGYNLFLKKNYQQALKEFDTVLSLNPPDEELKKKTVDFYKKTERIWVKETALTNTQDALNYIKGDDYLSAGEKLKDALTAIFRIAREERSATD